MTQPTDRPGIDDLTSDMLDQLYDRAELAEADRDGWRERAHGYRTRAERAEATLNAVRALTQRMHDWDGDRPAVGKWATELRAVLDQHGQTPA